MCTTTKIKGVRRRLIFEVYIVMKKKKKALHTGQNLAPGQMGLKGTDRGSSMDQSMFGVGRGAGHPFLGTWGCAAVRNEASDAQSKPFSRG